VARVVVKRGDSLLLNCTRTDAGTAVDLTGYTVSSQLRHPTTDELAATLTVTLSNQGTNPGEFVLSALPATTADLALGVYQCDVQFTSPGGVVVSSPTFEVELRKDVTR